MELLIREKLLAALLALYIALLILDPSLLRRSPWLLKPDTLCSLATLFIASRAAELSGLFSRVSVAIVRRFAEMPFALYSVLILSAGLTAMLITNDAALFIYLPLVASIESVWGVDLLSLYVVTTISVNVLSALTPIGNPQNLFLWQHYALGFAEFVVGLAPFTGVATAILLIYALTLATRIERCSKPPPPPPVRVNRILAASSVAMLAALVALTHLGVSWAALPLAVALSVAVSPTVLKGTGHTAPSGIRTDVPGLRGTCNASTQPTEPPPHIPADNDARSGSAKPGYQQRTGSNNPQQRTEEAMALHSYRGQPRGHGVHTGLASQPHPAQANESRA